MKEDRFVIKEMIRPNCEDLEPYIAGKPVETIRRELKLKKVVKLASNENPLGPSIRARAAMRTAIGNSYFYPDSSSWSLKRAIAKKFGVDVKNVSLGAGSDEMIQIIAEVFFKPADEIIVSDHAFIQYRRAGRLMNAKVITVPMKDFRHDLAAMAKAVGPCTKAIFIANPNNPTGTYNTRTELDVFLDTVKARAERNLPLVIIDEAYYDYARLQDDYPETLRKLGRWPNLIILRTFSKIYGLAGLRIGYAFASPEIVSYMERVRPPFDINIFAQAAGEASLKDVSQVRKSVRLVKKEKQYLYERLTSMKVPFIPSAANFILINVSPALGKDVFNMLLKKGVIVRAMDEYDLPYHIRVSIGLPDENRFFIRELSGALRTGEHA